jgi:acyl carrier protein
MISNNNYHKKKKLYKVFSEALGVSEGVIVDDLQYNSIPEWDSVAHMVLVLEIENIFNMMLEPNDIVEMSSPIKALKIIEKY